LVRDALDSNRADHCVLPAKSFLKRWKGCVIRLDDFDAIWEFGLRDRAREDCDGEIGGEKRFDDVCAEISSALVWRLSTWELRGRGRGRNVRRLR
jgi:hypothetical protein